jgi:hypothetical protein
MAVTDLQIYFDDDADVVHFDLDEITNLHLITAVNAVDELSFDAHIPITQNLMKIHARKSKVFLMSDQGNFSGCVAQVDLSQSDNGTVSFHCTGAKAYLQKSWVFPGSAAPDEPSEEPTEEEEIQTNVTRSNPEPEPGPINIDLGALKKGNSLGSILRAVVSTHNSFVVSSERISFTTPSYYIETLQLKKDLELAGQNLYDAMNSIAEAFAIEWDVVWDGVLTNYPQLKVAKKFGKHMGELKTGLNLNSISKTENATDIYTAILPLGGVGYDGKRLSLCSVACNSFNAGAIQTSSVKTYSDISIGARPSPIVKNMELVKLYGIQIKLMIYDNINVQAPEEWRNKRNELLEQAIQDCDSLSQQTVSYSVNAFDFENADIPGIGPKLEIYNYYTVNDYITGINTELRLTKKDTNFDDILNPSLTFELDNRKENAAEPAIISNGITPVRPVAER